MSSDLNVGPAKLQRFWVDLETGVFLCDLIFVQVSFELFAYGLEVELVANQHFFKV